MQNGGGAGFFIGRRKLWIMLIRATICFKVLAQIIALSVNKK
jgi:hypothetical protein